ncbi:site-specific integrase [Shewanella olleyana]|uniref:site-specific integrase n=1 Tax=Shewanella olleyana TaxID=135626 RepID=UPI00200C6167|nr:site-specific integrase [Shewanella olleyana]MCL1068692.1 site-specific integrase [Shewanella olleyana]
MNLKVEIYKDTTGNPFPLIVKNGIFPACLYLNAYLNGNHNSPLSRSKRGKSSQSPSLNTLIKYAYELKLIYSHFTSKNINLAQRVSSGEFISQSELEDFVRVCKLYADNEDIGKSEVVNLTNRRIQNAIHATINSQVQVSAHTFRQRLIRFRCYIENLYMCQHYGQCPSDEIASLDVKFRAFQQNMNRYISGIRNDNTVTKDPLSPVISTEDFFNLLEIIKSSSPHNPFKLSKLRNQIIMQILIETGVRVGAILKLKISDLIDDWSTPRFLLTRTLNDTSDKRRIPAKNKTKAISVSVSSDLMKLLKLYIETTRAAHSQASKHDFIIISEKGKSSGQPITYDAVYKITDKFGKTINTKLFPHKLRHKWNEIFSINAELAGYSQDQVEDMRKYSMGWVEDSKMVNIYNEFKLAVKVAELSRVNQKKSVPTLS